jgi:hypothetical protein
MGGRDVTSGGADLDPIQISRQPGYPDGEKDTRDCKNQHQLQEGKAISHGAR